MADYFLTQPANKLTSTIASLRGAFVWSAVFSLCVNLLLLTVPLYLLQLFDRVLTSRSIDTLWVLTLIAVIALIAFGILEAVRRHVLARTGAIIDRQLATSALATAIRKAPVSAGKQRAAGVKDLQTLRTYLGSQAFLPLLDAPWSFIFLATIFFLHPVLGWLALAAFVILGLTAVLNERLTRDGLSASQAQSAANNAAAENAVENAEVVVAMGMTGNVVGKWRTGLEAAVAQWNATTGRLVTLGSISKVMRLLVQVVVLATGALLTLQGTLSPGAMIAASILVTRALGPVEQLVGSWGTTVSARNAYRNLKQEEWPQEQATTSLPAPAGALRAENITYVHPGQEKPVIQGVSFELKPGESLGLIGPTGSGKTTLARLLLGVLPPRLGSVRLDGASLADWDESDRGPHIGYLPQDLELFEGTVAENIARFGEADSEKTVQAAQLAGAHDTILGLAQGYDTPVGPRGVTLSGGQRQRIALARALYGDVRLVVLDEPNANQDRAGEVALLRALQWLKQKGITSIVIAHRPAIIQYVDKILVLRDGKVAGLGPREQVLTELGAATEQPAPAQALEATP
ncbi:type I secretion system permease/ATPase [Parahaliea maris]|uniref:type I secretion system permease/ATPase n=1 Tax=Parahaliea maris TaxID=2716870 RepID=UPI001650222C|nr:type I secretion system permease/ATPase [Parahaliea maris]